MPLPAGLTPVGGGLPAGLSPVDEDVQPSGELPPGLMPVDFSDVKGASSTTSPTYWGGVKSRFDTAIHHPMEAIGGALDPLLKPVRETLQRGGITGEMLPDIAKQVLGPKAGGFAAGIERDVAPGLVSGENAAIMGGMAMAPQSAAFLLPKFGKEGAQQAIASTQVPAGETPEEAGRRYAQGVGGAAMALAPIIHGAAGPVREAVSRFREPAARLDFDAVNRESMGEGPGQRVLDTKIEAPAEIRPVPPREAAEPTFTGIAEGDKFDVSPEKPLSAGPLEVPREIQDAAAEIPEASPLEIQQAAERLRALDEGAGKSGAAAGDTATGSLGESAGTSGQRAADPAARGGEPVEAGAPEAGQGPWQSTPRTDVDGPARRVDGWDNGKGGWTIPESGPQTAALAPKVLYTGQNGKLTDFDFATQRGRGGLHGQGVWMGNEESAGQYGNSPHGRQTIAVEPKFKNTKRIADESARDVDANALRQQGYDSVYLAQSGYWIALTPDSIARRGVEPRAGEGAAPVDGGLPLEQPDLTLRSIRDFQRAAGVPEYEGSRFSRSNQGIRDAVTGNEAALVERGRRARIGEALSDEVQYALKKHTDDLVRNGGDQAEIQRNYKILSESNSAKGRQLQALQTAIDNVDHTDPAAVVGLAQKATNGKLSIQAQMDLADMSRKAGEMKAKSAEAINKRAEAALTRLEGMGEQIKRLTIKDVIGCP